MGSMKRFPRLVIPFLALAAMCAVQANPPSATVYCTENGKKYHRKNCRLKQGSKGMTLATAKKKGYKPCAVCKPPK